MRFIKISIILIVLSIVSFIGCSSDDSYVPNTYIINALESREVPSNANVVANSEGSKIKITRDIESDSQNIYVISGSVKVTEIGDAN